MRAMARPARRLLRAADERLARSVVLPRSRPGRKYRCSSCGLMTATDELTPDKDEDGRVTGWTCNDCL